MKKIFSVFIAAVFCALLIVPVFAKENAKADFGFSLSGGNYQGKTSWMGDFYLAQDWRFGSKGLARNFAFLFQGSGMAYVYDTKNSWENGEYGASVGLGPEYYFSDSAKLGAYVFVDALGKNRDYFAQYRPTIMFTGSRLKAIGGVALHLTKPLVINTTVSAPIFWADDLSYYYNIQTDRQVAHTIDYFFLRGEAIYPFNFTKLSGEYIRGMKEYEDIQRLQLGAELKVFKWLSLELQWFKTKAENVFLSKWFNQDGFRYALRIDPFAAAGKFADFIQRKFVEVFWPVVIIRDETEVNTTKIADRLELELDLKEEYCVNEQVEISGIIKGGTKPYHVYVDLGDGIGKIDFAVSEESFTVWKKYLKKSGADCYSLSVRVVDAYGFEVMACKCIKVKDCFTPCVPARIVYFKPNKYSIKQGESITITGKIENAPNSILDGGEFNDKVEQDNPFTEIATPSKTTTYWLRAPNDCPSEDRASFTVLVDECKKIVLKDSDLQVSPLSVDAGEKVTVTVNMAENATGLIATKDGVSFATEPGVYEFSFSGTGTHEFKVAYKNDCSTAEISKTVTVTEPCVMCDEQKGVTFHTDGSFVLDKNNFPEGQNIEFNFQTYNKSDCAFEVPIKYDVRYQDGGQEKLISGSQNIGTVPAHTVWNMKFKYTWNTKTVTLTFVSSSPFLTGLEPIAQCPSRKVKVKLSIGNCGPL